MYSDLNWLILILDSGVSNKNKISFEMTYIFKGSVVET